MTTGLELVLLAVLIAWTAFFVAAEYAFVASRPTRMRELAGEGNKRAQRVLAVQQNPTMFISSIQVAITFSALATGAVGEPAVRRLVQDALSPLGSVLSTSIVTLISIVLGFLVIISVTVVLGEIVPKALALARTERIAMAVVGPVQAFTAVVRPFVWLLERLSALTLRLFGMRTDIRLGFDFADTEARQVMVPRPDVVGLPLTATVSEAAGIAESHPYTRYPVFGDDIDDVHGVVHIRQLFEATRAGSHDAWIRDLVRPVQKVPETKNLDDLLLDFRRTQSHLAIVVDEYGSTAGVVTLEDLVEEIMGEIDDEFDVPSDDVVVGPGGRITVVGSYAIEDFNERFGTAFDDEDVNSIGGVVFHALGRVPEEGDSTSVPGMNFTVLEMDGSRIVRVLATPQADLPGEATA